jgi:hypothetical protein
VAAVAAGGAMLGALASSRGGSDGPPVALLPDLQQRAPFALTGETVRTSHGLRFRLAFGSAVDNVGAGPLIVAGRRVSGGPALMEADQLVRLSDGSTRRYPHVGRLRYTLATTHQHWHLLHFDRYELRSLAGGKLVRPDRKTGFCLGDRYESDELVTLRREPAEPVWTDECGKRQPLLAALREGISVGYGDNYAPLLEGQYIDVTGLPPGRYELVHRANADRSLRESDYRNDAASVVISLAWPRGRDRRPEIDVVARCSDGRRCVKG